VIVKRYKLYVKWQTIMRHDMYVQPILMIVIHSDTLYQQCLHISYNEKVHIFNVINHTLRTKISKERFFSIAVKVVVVFLQ